ncbi:DNA polymerase III, delta subunit [Desulfurobacterium pacificum]|uniref:DNA-directed DNA polymerase n=1 Tax=Desulfurobacterium pacificum TaxID=240166 RepID=A0ABY1NKG7_9BACT|nr:DNA polymerase III subunit delta [Desulfurobacterium pacificum]SMP11844.1 DNA polymerase III, delta subunit [Desulfurobacterium pacificum]
MKQVKVQDALKQLKNNVPWKRIFIYGDEIYLTEQLIKKISSFREVEKFYADEDLSAIYSFSGTSLFGSSPVLLITNAQHLPSALRKKSEKEKFLKFLKTLPEFIVAATETLDYKKLKSEIFQTITELAEIVIVSESYHEKAVYNLLKKKFSSAGKQISDQAIRLIIETVGTDLLNLKQETDKLLAYPGELTEETVRQILFSSGRVNVFEIIVPLVEKNRKEFLKLISTALSEGVDPLSIIGLLQSQVRQLIAILTGEKPKLPLKAQKTFKELSRRTTIKDLFLLLQKIHEAEFATKSGEKMPELAIKSIVLEDE